MSALMRIAFFGASDVGWECCRALLEDGLSIVGLFSIPPEFRISWSSTPVTNVRFHGFEDLSVKFRVPLTYINGRMTDPAIEDEMRRLNPDLILVIGWYYLVPRSLRQLAVRGALGLHASLLPRFRGGAPLVWAMINGETQTGVSLFHLEDGVDEGDVIAQKSFPIARDDDISDVIHKTQTCSVELIRKYIPLFAEGHAPRIRQDASFATVMPQRKPEDGKINWAVQSADEVYNWVRAQTRPYPGAFSYFGTEKLIIWKCRLRGSEPFAGHPGEIVCSPSHASDPWGVCCADGRVVDILEIGCSDGRYLSGADFRRERKLDSATQKTRLS
jgi:methionyl-tRNA formyltransferase